MQTRIQSQDIKYKAVNTVKMVNWYSGNLEKGNFIKTDAFRKALSFHYMYNTGF